MRISISICPTRLEIDGDMICPTCLEKEYREACEGWAGKECEVDFQIGYRQGHKWFHVSDDFYDNEINDDGLPLSAEEKQLLTNHIEEQIEYSVWESGYCDDLFVKEDSHDMV